MPTKQVTLDGGAIVSISIKFEYAKCKGCPADDLIWATLMLGGNGL